MFATKIVLVLGVALLLNYSTALRCRTEDGPSMDEVKKVVRTCMNRHDSSGSSNKNPNRSNKNNDYDDSGSRSESDEDDSRSQEDQRSNYNNNNNNYNSNRYPSGNQYPYNGDDRGNNNGNNQRGHDNRNNGNNQNHRQYLVAGFNNILPRHPAKRMVQLQPQMDPSNNPWNWKKDSSSNNRQQRSYDAYSNNGRDEGDGNNSSAKIRNVDSNSCMVLCFFQEMKMTNRDGYPDKHRMLNVMTHDLRDMQLKDFYMDTIQECHHILEMEQTREKCTFARHLVTCLSERARSNCDDFQDSILF